MSRYVNDKAEGIRVRDAFYSRGTITLGECEGGRETKWCGWRVIYLDGHIYACVTGPRGDYSCATEITRDEIDMHVDDTAAALMRLDEVSHG